MISRYRAALGRSATGKVWAVIWLLTLAVPFLPLPWLMVLVSLTWLSALALAPGRFHGGRLLKMAMVFLVFWGVLISLTHLAYPASLRPIPNLAAWLGLGLNLMLAKTPLQLALSSAKLLNPWLGPVRSRKLSLALALLARLIPQFLSAALEVKRTLDKRVAGMPLTRRLVLWAGGLVRVSLNQNNDLARALVKRWPS